MISFKSFMERLGHEPDHEIEIRRKASNIKKQARNSRIRKGIAPNNLYFYHSICVSYRWKFWCSSSFVTVFTWGFSKCSKEIYVTDRISQPQDQLDLCACILSKRWTSAGPPTCGTHVLWPTPSCMLVMAHRSQLLYLASSGVFTFNSPRNLLEWALEMNQPAAPDLTLLATRRHLNASCHFLCIFFLHWFNFSLHPIKSHNES